MSNLITHAECVPLAFNEVKEELFSAFCQNRLGTVKDTERAENAVKRSSLKNIMMARDYHGESVQRNDQNAEFLAHHTHSLI